MSTTSIPDGNAFLAALAATPAGRECLLNVAVDAEEGDETGLFDQLADAVATPDLRNVVITHRDDEVRHAGLYRECLARNGYAKIDLPPEVSVVHQARMISERGDEAVETAEDVVGAVALLLCIEERGVERFPHLADAFESYDPETAAVYRRVTRDERGHVRYCHRIGRHHAASEEAWQGAIAAAREIEAEAFVRAGLALVEHCAAAGLVDLEALTAPA